MSKEMKLKFAPEKLFHRQRDNYARAASDFGFDAKSAAMCFDDASDDCQAESRSLGFRRAQDCGERALLQFIAHAFAGVFEFHGDVRWLRTFARLPDLARLDCKRAAVGHGFGGVEN